MSLTAQQFSPISHCDLSGIRPGDHERAFEVIDAMADKFDVPARDFAVVRAIAEIGDIGYFTDFNYEFSSDTTPVTVAVYAAGNGLDLGTWKDIMSSRKGDFSIEVGGRQVDTREGMTMPVYRAMVEQARKAGATVLQDSLELDDENGERWTATFLTGEFSDLLTEHEIRAVDPIGTMCFSDSGPLRGGISRHHQPKSNRYRFRPAVRLEPKPQELKHDLLSRLRNRGKSARIGNT